MLELEFAQIIRSGTGPRPKRRLPGPRAPDSAEQARTHGWLFALADGVGGHERARWLRDRRRERDRRISRSATNGEPTLRCCKAWCRRPTRACYEAGMAAAPGGVSMATTLVACALRYDRAVVAHVGDSRCYLIRQGHAHGADARSHRRRTSSAPRSAHRARSRQAETRHLLSRSLGTDYS